MKKIIFIFSLLTLLYSQTVFDDPYATAEATSLAGAVVANPGGEIGLFHNPAALAEVENRFVSFGSTKLWVANFTYAAFIFNYPKIGNIGITLQQLTTDYNGTSLSEEQSIGLSGGYYLQNDKNSSLMIGYTVNFVSLSFGATAGTSGDGSLGLPASSGSTIGFDLGLATELRGKYRIGAYLKNINSPVLGKGITQQFLPRRITVGVAYLPYKELITSITVDKPLGRTIEVKSGIQYKLNDLVTFRLGITNNPNRMSGGFSINLKQFNLDFGAISHPVLSSTQQLSFGWNF